jgi:hypothetical protein
MLKQSVSSTLQQELSTWYQLLVEPLVAYWIWRQRKEEDEVRTTLDFLLEMFISEGKETDVD